MNLRNIAPHSSTCKQLLQRKGFFFFALTHASESNLDLIWQPWTLKIVGWSMAKSNIHGNELMLSTWWWDQLQVSHHELLQLNKTVIRECACVDNTWCNLPEHRSNLPTNLTKICGVWVEIVLDYMFEKKTKKLSRTHSRMCFNEISYPSTRCCIGQQETLLLQSDYHLFRSMLHSGVAEQYFIFHQQAKHWLDYWIARKGNFATKCICRRKDKKSPS